MPTPFSRNFGPSALLALLVAALCPGLWAQSASQYTLVPTGNSPISITAGDVYPGDGAPDLVYCDPPVNSISTGCHLLHNTGSGSFTQGDNYTAVAMFQNNLYLASTQQTGTVGMFPLTLSTRTNEPQRFDLFTQLGGGSRIGVGFVVNGSLPAVPGAVAYLSLDSDPNSVTHGKLAYLAEDAANGYIYIIDPSASNLSTLLLADGAGQVITGDFNGDRKLDFLVNSTSAHTVTQYTGAGDGTFTASSAVSLPNGILSMLVADIDGDGIPDLVVEDAAGSLSYFRGTATGFLATPIPVPGAQDASTGRGGRLIAIADLNGDGFPDIITYTPLGVSVLLAQAPLTNHTPQVYSYVLRGIYNAGPGHTSFALADFNRDGHPDLAVDNPQGIAILFGLPDGSFGTQLIAGLSVVSSPEPSAYGADFILTATVSVPQSGAPTPTGAVTFSVDGVTAGTVALNGSVATYTVVAPTLPKGSHTITAAYAGDATYTSATFSATHTVIGLRSQTTYVNKTPTIFYGQVADGSGSVSAVDTAGTATVNGGSISFFENGNLICVLPINGLPGICPDSAGAGFPVGLHVLTAMYSGNDFYAPSTSDPAAGNVQVLPDNTTAVVTSSASPATVGQPVILTATVAAPYATPTGTVLFYDGAILLGSGTLNANGVATFATSALTLGTHSITASYAATTDFNASVSPVFSQVVTVPQLQATFTGVTSSVNPSFVGQPVTFTATVTSGATVAAPIPVGTVNFTVDGLLFNPITLNATGSASITTSALSQGAHTVVATFNATTILAASASPILIQQVNPQGAGGFTLTVAPSSLAVPIGSSVSVLVTVTPLNGFAQTVNLSCSGMPDESACTFANAAIPAGGGSTRLTVYAAAPHNCGTNTPYFVSSGPTTLLGGLAATTLMFLLRRRRHFFRGLALAMILTITPALSGCSGNCTDLGVRPGTYSFTVTGASAGSPALTVAQAAQFTAHL